jgi:hypothetical protein
MPKFTFIAEHASGEKVTFETDKVHIHDVLEDFQMFLRGVGFHYTGTLDIVQDEYELAHKQYIPDSKVYNV